MSNEPQLEHVLFVDDEPVMHRLVERALRRQGPALRVTWAGNGAQALSVLERQRVDLLITALAVPVLDGVELLRHAANRRLEIPMIVTSGHAPPAPCGPSVIRFVREPIHPDSLAALVRERLHHDPRGGTVSVADFARLLGMVRRSGALRARSEGVEGVLVFAAGVLVDATLAGTRGDAAAREILGWPQASLRIDELVRAVGVTVTRDLETLQAEADGLRQRRTLPAAPPAPGIDDIVDVDASDIEEVDGLDMTDDIDKTDDTDEIDELLAGIEAGPPGPVVRPGPTALPAYERPAAQGAIAALLDDALKISGALACVLAVWELDHVVGARNAGGVHEAAGRQAVAAASANARVMRALMTTMTRLGRKSELADVIITIDGQVHIFAPLSQDDRLYLCVVVDAARGNLALARLRMQRLVAEFRPAQA